MTDAERAALRRQIEEARAELHEAQRIDALLADDFMTGAGGIGSTACSGDALQIARAIIERDLAARRVEAWVAVLDRFRAEGVRLGLFE